GRAAWRCHKRFQQYWMDRLPFDEAALLSAITLGSRGVLPVSMKEACIRAGVYHILVVSGQKVALLIALGVSFLRFLKVPGRWAFWVAAPLIVLYAGVVGADPPVVRASAMALVVLACLALGRDVPRFYPLYLAGFWILLREP